MASRDGQRTPPASNPPGYLRASHAASDRGGTISHQTTHEGPRRGLCPDARSR